MEQTDIQILLTAWFNNLNHREKAQPIRFATADMQAGIPAGSAKNHLRAAAEKLGCTFESEGEELIQFKVPPLRFNRV